VNEKIIGVVSGKGGVGKTTTVVNLSAALMEFNKNVIAIDTDVKMSGLGLQLGMYYFPVTLNDVLMNRGNIFEAMYIHSTGLRIIPASLYMEDVKYSELKTVFEDSFLEGNIVLVDGPPGLQRDAMAIMRACPELLIVTTPEIPAITDAMKIISACRMLKTTPIGIIINMYRKRDPNQIKPKEIESICGLPVIGIVPEDKNVKKGIFKGIPGVILNPHSSSSIAFKRIAAHLIEEEYKPSKLTVFKKFLRRFRR